MLATYLAFLLDLLSGIFFFPSIEMAGMSNFRYHYTGKKTPTLSSSGISDLVKSFFKGSAKI